MIIESYLQTIKKTVMRNLQFTGEYYGETITITQVQKRTAKKLFESGETIYMQACNMQPFGVWTQCHEINKDSEDGATFESIVNNFEYNNCSNESGLYATFYKRKRKFQKGDKVRIKAGVSSKTHGYISPIFVTSMDELIGKELTVEGYGNLFVRCYGYYFSEECLEPYEELKKGDLAIFWDNGAQHRASVRMYGGLFMRDYCDTGGVRWDNAIKFESKEQYEKLINGEL